MSPYQTGALLSFVGQAARIDQFFDPEILSRCRFGPPPFVVTMTAANGAAPTTGGSP